MEVWSASPWCGAGGLIGVVRYLGLTLGIRWNCPASFTVDAEANKRTVVVAELPRKAYYAVGVVNVQSVHAQDVHATVLVVEQLQHFATPVVVVLVPQHATVVTRLKAILRRGLRYLLEHCLYHIHDFLWRVYVVERMHDSLLFGARGLKLRATTHGTIRQNHQARQ